MKNILRLTIPVQEFTVDDLESLIKAKLKEDKNIDVIEVIILTLEYSEERAAELRTLESKYPCQILFAVRENRTKI